MTSIRCSSLPLVSACAAASIQPDCRIESPRGASDLGSAFHECMAAFILRPPVNVDEVAAANNVDAKDLAPMFGWAANLWRDRLAELFPNPLVEDELLYSDGDLTLTGHADLLSLVGDEIRGLDWKSGWRDSDSTEQMKGYGFLALQRWLDAEYVRFTVLRVRDQRADTLFWHRDELQAWFDWTVDHVADSDVYRPGAHCGYCPRALECTAHRNLAKWWADFAVAPTIPRDLDAPDLAQAVVFTRMLGKRIDSFLEAAKAHVEAIGGEYGPLYLDERPARSIDFARGHETIVEAIGGHAFMDCVKVSKTAVEEAVKRDAPRGQKGQRVKDLMAKLDQAGAIETTVTKQLKVRRDYGDNNGTSPAAIEAGSIADSGRDD